VIGGWQSANGSYDRESGTKALHLVSAWASEHRLVLAQAKVQDKSNEITAIPALLELLDLAGCIVTLDAMGTQKSIAHQIHTAGADYILSLKSNHPTLFQQVEQWFQQMQADGSYPPHVNTPLSLDITASTHAPFGHSRWTLCCPYQADAGRTAVLSSWNGLVGYGTKPPTKCSSTSAVCRRIALKIAAAIRQHWGLKTDCIDLRCHLW